MGNLEQMPVPIQHNEEYPPLPKGLEEFNSVRIAINAEAAKRQRAVDEGELMEILQENSLFQANENLPETDAVLHRMECDNENCAEASNAVESLIYAGHGNRQNNENLSGDFFTIRQEKDGNGNHTEKISLIDAEGHGAGATPSAILSSSFLKAAEKEGIEDPLVALDIFLSSLNTKRREVSLLRAKIETRADAPAKTLSLERAGNGYAFWVDGNETSGFKLKMVSETQIVKTNNDFFEPIDLDKGATTVIGWNLLARYAQKNGALAPDTFSLPKDAGVFFSTDGVFDMKNAQTDETFIEELPAITQKFFQENRGRDRQYIERALFELIKQCSQEYIQTDDETLFKIAA